MIGVRIVGVRIVGVLLYISSSIHDYIQYLYAWLFAYFIHYVLNIYLSQNVDLTMLSKGVHITTHLSFLSDILM